MIIDIMKNFSMIISLAKSDFKKRFTGSYFGLLWMFISPLATILVYTLIFQVGFKAMSPVEGYPYVMWLIPGIIPWFFFQDALIQGTNVLYEYNFLVKKVVFNVNMLPNVKIVSVFFAHICFVIMMFIVFIIAKIQLTINIIFIIYYSFATFVLSLGVVYFTSSVNVFFKDMTQIVSIFLQFGIWMCPIMYDEGLFKERLPIVCTLLKLNPFYYIVSGYRMSMLQMNLDKNLFIKETMYFWAVTIIIFFIGSSIYNKLRPHFADIL